MSNDITHLRTLLKQSSDADLLREMIGFTAQRLMELQVQTLSDAAIGEHSPDRLSHRKGYRDRLWNTRAESVQLRIPELRRTATYLASSNPGAWARSSSPPSSRKPAFRACPSVRSATGSKPWAWPSSPSARFRGRAPRSTSACKASFSGP